MDRRRIPLILLNTYAAFILLVLSTSSSALLILPSGDVEEDVRMERASVVTGRTAELPCDITPPPLDSLYLVLWYKNDSDFPIYKYDARRSRESYRQQQQQPWPQHPEGGGPIQDGSYYSSSSSGIGVGAAAPATRVHFQFDRHPALLLLNNVVDADEGFYRCRVDFGRSPTRNVVVQLTVIVPPQKIRIIENNREVSSVIGPYDEGSQLSLNCIVSGGRPRPEVSWWLDDQLVDHTFVGTSENVVQNVLVIQRLERRHLHAELRCQASNHLVNPATMPSSSSNPGNGTAAVIHAQQQQQQQQLHRHHVITSSVQLNLNLRPVTVSISGADKPLSAGKAHMLECTAGGSVPAASIHWYLHSVQQLAKERVSMDGINTTSTLRFTPTSRDHDVDIICSAFNPLMLGLDNKNNQSSAGVEVKKRLIIHFPPVVELELGRNLNPDDIVEGNDVYFECRIRSNPAPTRVTWTHEGQNIKENSSAGVIIVKSSLVIRHVSRAQSGKYSCTATNVEGSGSSNSVHLRVMYQPVCRPGQKTMYGVAKGETTQVKCNSDAIPPTHSYRWAFNTSTSESMDLPSSLNSVYSDVGGGMAVSDGSVISYSPQTDRDYGTLLCWARNDIGEQREPCVYRIFLGVRPDPPSNCSVINQTADAVEVWCRPGFDGGHAQQFQFEIFDTQSAVLLYNKSGRYPHLRVSQLDSGLKLFIQISAFNLRGRSALVPLEAYTVKIAEKQTVIMETTDLGSVLGIVSGVSGSLVMVCIAIGLTARFRHHHHHQQRRPQQQQQQQPGSSSNPSGSALPTAQQLELEKQLSAPHDDEDNSGEEDPDLLLGRERYQNETSMAASNGRHPPSTLMWNETSGEKRKSPPSFLMGRSSGTGILPTVHYYQNNSTIGGNSAANWMSGNRPAQQQYHSQSPSVEVITVKTPHHQASNGSCHLLDDVPETSI